jgi:hypothetical protein
MPRKTKACGALLVGALMPVAACDGGDIAIWIVLPVVLGIVAIGFAITLAGMRSKVNALVTALPGFQANRKTFGEDGLQGILIDENARKVCLTAVGPPPWVKVFEYRDILAVEILEDGQSLTKTIRTSQAAGAILGGLLLGPVGALAGALTAGKKTVNKVRSVDLKIVVNDSSRPVHVVKFLQGECDRTSFVYGSAIAEAREWHGLLMVLIEQADREEAPPVSAPAPSPTASSVADELTKLADLRDRGALTATEFEQQKATLLRGRG